MTKHLQIYEESQLFHTFQNYALVHCNIDRYRTDVKSSCFSGRCHNMTLTLYCQFILGQPRHSSGPGITVRAFWFVSMVTEERCLGLAALLSQSFWPIS